MDCTDILALPTLVGLFMLWARLQNAQRKQASLEEDILRLHHRVDLVELEGASRRPVEQITAERAASGHSTGAKSEENLLSQERLSSGTASYPVANDADGQEELGEAQPLEDSTGVEENTDPNPVEEEFGRESDEPDGEDSESPVHDDTDRGVAAPSLPTINWEEWLGVKGAALVGGVVLALAALLFFQYSIENGLISPTFRVIIGVALGLVCVGSEFILRRTRYAHTTNALAGSGVVILYGAVWAAASLYSLIPSTAAFVLMSMVTVTGGSLAIRHSSRVIAILGLVGGFLTPALLSTGSDRPIGLFGYLLVLNIGVYFVSRRRGWPILGLGSLVLTSLYQLGWIVDRMGGERIWLGLAVLAVFAALYIFMGDRQRESEQGRYTQLAAVLFPLSLGLYFGAADLGPHIYPVATFMGMLCIAALWVGRRQSQPWLGTAAAAMSGLTILSWTVRTDFTEALGWEAALASLGLALLFHIAAWLRLKQIEGLVPEARPDPLEFQVPFVVTFGAASLVTLFLGNPHAEPSAAPFWAALLLLCVMGLRHARLPGQALVAAAPAALLLLGHALTLSSTSLKPGMPSAPTYLALMVSSAALFLASGLWCSAERPLLRRVHLHTANGLAIGLLVVASTSNVAGQEGPYIGLGTLMLLGSLVVLGATHLPSGKWYAAAVGVSALFQTGWAFDRILSEPWPAAAAPALGLMLASVVGFTAWPFVVAARFRNDRWAWYASALSGALWFTVLRKAYVDVLGPDTLGILPVGLALITLAALARARKVWGSDQPMQKTALVWFSAVALGFISVAIPLQLSKSWVTIAWALEGAAVMLLWRRLDHPGLKYFGLFLLGAVTVRLVGNPYLLGYYARSDVPLVNWVMYTYWVPTAALAFASRVLHRDEVPRWRVAERRFFPNDWPWVTILTGAGALLVFFVWINVAIADWFGDGLYLSFDYARTPARELTTSTSWGVYALIILTLGVKWKQRGLRWTSLILLMITMVKVFLFDLGELEDLYQVASLVGLAVSLLIVSLSYQRFVFGQIKPTTNEEEPDAEI